MADTTTTKPGYKTTEFWLALLATVITLLYGSGLITSDTSPTAKVVAFIAAALTSLGYSASRGAVKKAASAPPA